MNYLLIALIVISGTCIQAQDIKAIYRVKTTVSLKQADINNSVILDYEGFLYKSEGKHIYFQKPLFLNKYPTGNLVFEQTGQVYLYPLWLDSIQRISYNNTDSLIFRTRNDMSGENAKNDYYVRRFELGVHEWKLLPETKEINGLFCQRAKYFDPVSNELMWDVWFCPNIEINYGPGGIRDLPGMVVEASNLITKESYYLESYNNSDSIPNNVFWPDEFNNAVFIKLKPLRKYISKEKTDSQKRLEIMNQ